MTPLRRTKFSENSEITSECSDISKILEAVPCCKLTLLVARCRRRGLPESRPGCQTGAVSEYNKSRCGTGFELVTFRLCGRRSQRNRQMPRLRPRPTEPIRPICTLQLPAAIPVHLISFLLEKPTILLPQAITVRGAGMRGKDETIRVEALGSADSRKMPPCYEAPSQEPWHSAARGVRHRCVAGQL
jgi:hypothetical protein